MEPYLYFGALGPHERQYQIPNFTGLALEPAHAREAKHDLTAALAYDDNSIAKIQAQDVLEHLPFLQVPLGNARSADIPCEVKALDCAEQGPDARGKRAEDRKSVV